MPITPPHLILVIGQSRDDVPTVVQAGGHHPGSHEGPTRRRNLPADFRPALALK